nr:MAG TPA: hypothetical protein [Caudoviricetes sp.]
MKINHLSINDTLFTIVYHCLQEKFLFLGFL